MIPSRRASPSTPLSTAVAVIWTTSVLSCLFVTIGWLKLILTLLYCVAGAAFLVRSASFVVVFGWLLLPIGIPLFAIHGLLNAGYRVDVLLGDWLPIRYDGLVFATVTTAHLGLVAAALTPWRHTSKPEVLGTFQRWNIPTPLLCFFAIGAVSAEIILTRARAVHLAQQARGIDWYRGLLGRFGALPRLLLPVVTATIIDASGRGTLMQNRGFGAAQLLLPQRWSQRSGAPTPREMALAASPIFFALFVRLVA